MGPTEKPYLLVGVYLMGPIETPTHLGMWVFGGAYVGPIEESPYGAHKGIMDKIFMGPMWASHMGPTQQPMVYPYGPHVGPTEKPYFLVCGYWMGPTWAPLKPNTSWYVGF